VNQLIYWRDYVYQPVLRLRYPYYTILLFGQLYRTSTDQLSLLSWALLDALDIGSFEYLLSAKEPTSYFPSESGNDG